MSSTSRLTMVLTIGLTVVMSGGWSLNADACPPFLQGVTSNSLRLVDSKTGALVNDGDVCAFSDRYQKARASIRAQGVDPDMIADARAPRLIDMDRWKYHTRGFLDIFGSYDPNFVYADPKGNWTVWPGWNSAAFYVDSIAQRNFYDLSHGMARIPNLDLKWLTYMHLRALATSEPGLAGKLRNGLELGVAFYRETAPKVSEIQAVDRSEYRSLLNPSKAIVSFRRSRCFDELTFNERSAIKNSGRIKGRSLDFSAIDADAGSDFKDSNDVLRHCGYFKYADQAEVQSQLEALFRDISGRVDKFTIGRTYAWQTEHNVGSDAFANEDPILIAARAQRWFVSIHPFGGGNGRTSRFFMDYISESLGLPATTLASMNQDVITSEQEWGQQIGVGMERVVRIFEDCAQHIHADRCQLSDDVYSEQSSLNSTQK